MMPDWKDVTSYSRGTRGKTEPQTWRLELPDLVISVTRRIHDDPTHWFLECPEFFAYHKLDATDINEAQREAVAKVRYRLKMNLDAL